jgi:hypothetical protein
LEIFNRKDREGVAKDAKNPLTQEIRALVVPG